MNILLLLYIGNKIFDDPMYESLRQKDKDGIAYSENGIYDNGLGW